MSYTTAQASRVAVYRRHRRPESLSDSREEEQITGEAHSLRTAPTSNAGGHSAGTPSSSRTPVVATPRRSGSGWPGAEKSENAAAGKTLRRPPSAAMGSQNLPSDITSYILELERQNHELRGHIVELQQGQQPRFPVETPGANPLRSQEEKQMFLNDVLSQVEVVVQAHRNKTDAEIQRYKSEAAQAQQALRNLRNAIQQEGMDLTMAPAMIGFQRKAATRAAPEGVSGIGGDAPLSLAMPPESQQLLSDIAEDVLQKLVAVQASDDVPEVVRRAVKKSFESVVAFFTDQLLANFRESEIAMDALRSEVVSLKQELRTQVTLNENQRLQLVQDTEGELQALRDELHAFHLASAGGDDVQAAVQERAMEQYTQMLIETRRDAANLRQELENEKNHSAEVCLRLKTALKKRNAEFEAAVIQRAEEVVQQRERWIVELESKLREKENVTPKTFADSALQVGDPSISAPSEETYVSSLLLSLQKDSRSVAKKDEMFEKQLWRKTQELLNKYGNGGGRGGSGGLDSGSAADISVSQQKQRPSSSNSSSRVAMIK